jgi:Ca-activated chloride channel family protein
MRTKFFSLAVPVAVTLALSLLADGAGAAGTLTPVGSPDAPIEIRDHHVEVVINNGFARTEVTQTFFNPNPHDLEAIYAFPIPKAASLSEMTIFIGELQIEGEVVAREEAETIYDEEKRAGNDAGLGTKNAYQTYEFRVTPVRANAETRVRFVYYQPLEIDTGIGRYVYPLEDGGTDELAKSFWLTNTQVEGSFSVSLELKSAVPVSEVRTPGYEAAAQVDSLGQGHYRVFVEHQGAQLSRDFVFYYRLQEGLPGRVELIPYRVEGGEPGHFMLLITPGIDLQPLAAGADYVFILDVSGSMSGKIHTLAQGVSRALGELRPEDRFRVVTFNDRGRELTPGWLPASLENVERTIQQTEALKAGGSTNLFEGIQVGLERLDDDRATSVVLITDAVTNTGVVDPRAFHQLMKRYDVRVFGFLMGNSANWPLMRAICQASDGFYASVSNADDILGQILLAKSKITSEALHDVELEVKGVKVFDTTGAAIRKLYRGQQLALFGRYENGGEATVELRARLTGQDQTYTTRFAFPAEDVDHPEIERLWAMAMVEDLEDRMNVGLLDPDEGSEAIRSLGLAYQLVTDETAMLVLHDEAFERYGIERQNRERVRIERAAQEQRALKPIHQPRVDRKKPMFPGSAPSIGGGGAIDPLSGALALGLAMLAGLRARRSGRFKKNQ